MAGAESGSIASSLCAVRIAATLYAWLPSHCVADVHVCRPSLLPLKPPSCPRTQTPAC